MQDPRTLHDFAESGIVVPEGLPLVAGLTGFTDSGAAVTQFNDYVLETLDHTTVARFDNDELLDYRARRPIIHFEHDHLTDYEPPSLALHLVRDELNQPFLLLSGYEPDFQWERFTAAMLDLVEQLRVSTVTWVHAIPMPVPHTRPIGVTVSGNRSELIESMSIWKPRTQVPANVLHLMEFRLQESSTPTAGFVLLIPHYLADTEYPSAAVTALESVSAATGLIFPTDRLREDSRDFLAKIDSQVESNAELAKLVTTLEERHDSYVQDNPLPSPLMAEDGELPSADEIAAELQNFLAIRRNGDEAATTDER